ncbi:unnamed protein product [Nippostrongylus brasiliensis]|uniref:Transmembrane protein n=1 Tax=Nippostrongylus brasiliensis TaxID=27835 RepID=A0A0N4XWA6_NIPBR|nr:unnamed protein product [Nippostrongylus brasiliensis]
MDDNVRVVVLSSSSSNYRHLVTIGGMKTGFVVRRRCAGRLTILSSHRISSMRLFVSVFFKHYNDLMPSELMTDGDRSRATSSAPFGDLRSVLLSQGTLMIGIVSAVFTVFGLFSTIFSGDAAYIALFEVLYLLIDAGCLACLFIAVFKSKKQLLIPFFLSQEFVISTEEVEIEKSHPEIAGKMLIRLTATFLAVGSLLLFGLTFWWIVVVHRCYQYFNDIEKHRDPYDAPVAYNSQQGVEVY